MGRPQVPLKASRTDMVSTRRLGGLMDRKDQKTESFNWVGKEKQQRIKEKGSGGQASVAKAKEATVGASSS